MDALITITVGSHLHLDHRWVRAQMSGDRERRGVSAVVVLIAVALVAVAPATAVGMDSSNDSDADGTIYDAEPVSVTDEEDGNTTSNDTDSSGGSNQTGSGSSDGGDSGSEGSTSDGSDSGGSSDTNETAGTTPTASSSSDSSSSGNGSSSGNESSSGNGSSSPSDSRFSSEKWIGITSFGSANLSTATGASGSGVVIAPTDIAIPTPSSGGPSIVTQESPTGDPGTASGSGDGPPGQDGGSADLSGLTAPSGDVSLGGVGKGDDDGEGVGDADGDGDGDGNGDDGLLSPVETTIETTRTILPGPDQVVYSLLAGLHLFWAPGGEVSSGAASGVVSGNTTTGQLFGAVSPGPSGSPVTWPSQVAFGIGTAMVTSGLAAFRSGLAGGGLSNVPATFAPVLFAVTPGISPAWMHAKGLKRFVRMVSPLRYSRHDDSDPLEHDTRAHVYETVLASPGAYLSEVAQQADLPLSTTRHHVRVLEREGLVSGAKVRGKRRFYPANANGIELAAALSDDATATLLDVIARMGAVSVSDLAEELGRDPSTVSHHLQRLETDDIIVRERNGRTVMNKLAPEAREALESGLAVDRPVAPGATAGGAD